MKKIILNVGITIVISLFLVTLTSCGGNTAPVENAGSNGKYQNNYQWRHKEFAKALLDSLYKVDLNKSVLSEFSKKDKDHYTLKGCPLELCKKIDDLYEKSYGNVLSGIVIYHKNVGVNETQAFSFTDVSGSKQSLSRNDSMDIYNKINSSKKKEESASKKKEKVKAKEKPKTVHNTEKTKKKSL